MKMQKFKSNLKLLQGASLEEYNEYLRKLLLERGISADLKFNLEKLQQFIDEEKSFGKGLIAYLKDFEKQLDKITDDKDLKLYIFQILSELGSLVFPNTSACYSIIPSDLKAVDWAKRLRGFNNKRENKNDRIKIKEIETLLNIFLSQKYTETVSCLVALCLCNVLVRSMNNMNCLLVDENGEYVDQEEAMRPRLKTSAWIDQLSWSIRVHLHGVSGVKLTDDQKQIIQWYAVELAKEITGILLDEGLFVSYKTIQSSPLKNSKIQTANNKIKTAAYFAWAGSNLLAFPKTLALPMVYPPNDWVINSNEGADNGGYLLTSLTNISYQGYLDSKSQRIHDHRLYLKDIAHLNSLQKVKFTINERMVKFYSKYEKELTNSEIVLLSDKWVNPAEDLIFEVNRKWAKMFSKTSHVRDAIFKERISKQNETLRNQEKLKIADLYCNSIIYWPVIQDFRGRVYRIGHLNVQLDEFTRSLISFHSDKPFTNRKKDKSTQAKFNLLLKETLVEKDLIEKWDTVFGDRLIDNHKFDELLLSDVLTKKLSLIQAGQLLLIRQGAYDKIGVFYDASASAYQIMGLINADRQLCQITNVLQSDKPNGTKQDIYTFFLNRLGNEQYSEFKETSKKKAPNKIEQYLLEQINEESASCTKYLKDHFDRDLAKSIVMPLIYGKTSFAFSADLEEFFAKASLHPTDKYLMALASQIVKLLKNDSTFLKVNNFMRMLRSIGKLLFDLDLLTIRGPYNNSFVAYHKEEIERIRLYLKKGERYQSKQVSISKVVKNNEGNPERSKTKTINAFVANYIHFLDGVICHYVIKKLDNKSKEGTLALGTIHDCFFIKPSQAEILKKQYKDGLAMVLVVHHYNLVYWLRDLMACIEIDDNCNDARLLFLKNILNGLEDFQTKGDSRLGNLTFLNPDDLVQVLEAFKNKATPLKNKAHWDDIIEYFKICKVEDVRNIMDEILSDDTASLFPDNK